MITNDNNFDVDTNGMRAEALEKLVGLADQAQDAETRKMVNDAIEPLVEMGDTPLSSLPPETQAQVVQSFLAADLPDEALDNLLRGLKLDPPGLRMGPQTPAPQGPTIAAPRMAPVLVPTPFGMQAVQKPIANSTTDNSAFAPPPTPKGKFGQAHQTPKTNDSYHNLPKPTETADKIVSNPHTPVDI